MIEEAKKYSAFISYKHGDLDTFAAENLHKTIETFKVPKNIRKKTGRNKIERVFRDKDELPISSNLADNISNALQNSEYLIVVCSPRTPESYWVQKEIETFIDMHDREHVLAVLIEGEPEEAFPEQLRFAEQEHKMPDGSVTVERIPVEPLAADIRSKNKQELKKKLKMEILRIMAPLLGCGYDDLRQRHRERKLRRTIGVCAGISVCFLAFGLYSTYNTIQINQQYRVKQMNQSRYLAETSQRLLREGDRELAVKIALEALPEYAGANDRPYVAEAEYALSDALGTYADGNEFRLERQLSCNGNIREMTVSLDRSLLAARDSMQNIYIWNPETYELLVHIEPQYDENNRGLEWESIEFNAQNQLVCMTENFLECYDGLNGASVWRQDYEAVELMKMNRTGERIFISELENCQILDALTGEAITGISSYEPKRLAAFSPDSQYVVYNADLPEGEGCVVWNLQSNTTTLIQDDEWKEWGVNTIVFAGKKNLICSSTTFEREDFLAVKGIMVMYDVETQEEVWKRDEFVPEIRSYYLADDTEYENPITVFYSGTDICRVDIGTGASEALTMPFYVGYTTPLSEDTYFVVSEDGDIGLLSAASGNYFTLGQVAGDFNAEDCLLMNEHLFYRNANDNKIMVSSRMLGESFQACESEESYYGNGGLCTADGAYILLQMTDKLLVLSSETHEKLYEFPLNTINTKYRYKLYQDTNQLLYYNAGILCRYDLDTGEELEQVSVSESKREAFAFSRNGSWFAGADEDVIRVYNTGDFSQCRELRDTDFRDFIITGNGDYVAGRKSDGTFEIYNTATGTRVEVEETGLAVMKNLEENEVTLTVAHDQPWAVVYGTDQIIYVIDLQTGKTLHRIEVLCAEQCFLELTQDDATLLIADIDNSIMVYDLNTGTISKQVAIEDNRILRVSYLPESELCILNTRWEAYLLTTRDNAYTTVASVPGFLAMDENTGRIYVNSSREGFGYFIYQSLDDLIMQGKELVQYEELTELEKKTYNVE